MPIQSAFFAYPSSISEVCDAIAGAALMTKGRSDFELNTWVENDISGRPLTDPIFEKIENCDFLIADITSLNFNVTFEVGYAIGFGKRVHLLRNSNFNRDDDFAAKIGIFDTLGFETYTDQTSLFSLLSSMSSQRPIPLRSSRANAPPIYLLQTPSSNQAMLAIVGRIKKTRLTFGSFIPGEEIRLSAGRAIENVSNSLGVVVPLLSPSFTDALIHNIRGAFVAGLAYAMDKAVLMLQPADGPAPLDVRDLVKSYRRPEEIADHIAEFALEITERMQTDVQLVLPVDNLL